jgi:hypothetical protein
MNLKSNINYLLSSIVLLFFAACSESPDIVMQDLQLEFPKGKKVITEELLPGEIADTKIEHVAYAGPISQELTFLSENANMLLFIKGKGTLSTDTLLFDIAPETIAIPMAYHQVTIEVEAGDTIHFVQFTKVMSAQDRKDLASFPAENKYGIYFTRFEDCEPYTEKIKSPNTISRTVLPKDIVPRVSLGTVEAPGPDAVGAHEHPMLDQLFLGLDNNDITVHADDKSVHFKGLSLLHIPIGSSHSVTVGENKKMYYMWMDFFISSEGQEWLKTHQTLDDYKSK